MARSGTLGVCDTPGKLTLVMRALLSALVSLVTAALPLGAQRVWRSSPYPYLYYSTTDGLWGAAHYGLSSGPLGATRPQTAGSYAARYAGSEYSGSARSAQSSVLPLGPSKPSTSPRT